MKSEEAERAVQGSSLLTPHSPLATPGGLYLYCFARPGAAGGVDVPGVDGSRAIAEVELGPVAAVVSRVSLEEFGDGAAERNTQNPDWIIPRACRHQRVVQEVMARSGVLPVRFGAVFSSDERLAELVHEKCQEISGFLDWVHGKEEWAVKGLVDPDRAGAWLRANDPALAGQCGDTASPGARYFQEKRLRVAVQERLRGWCRCVAEEVHAQLDLVAEAARPLKLRAWGAAGKEGQLVLHRAFLLRRESVAAFLAHVERVGLDYAEQGLALGTSGPWPPYTFAPTLWGAQA